VQQPDEVHWTQKSPVGQYPPSVNRTARTSQTGITKEEPVEMAVQTLIFCAFFNCTRSSRVSSDAPDTLSALKRETPVGTV
jgi:hypothetical protein